MARLLTGAHFRARACILPESPKLETTRSLQLCQLFNFVILLSIFLVLSTEFLPPANSRLCTISKEIAYIDDGFVGAQPSHKANAEEATPHEGNNGEAMVSLAALLISRNPHLRKSQTVEPADIRLCCRSSMEANVKRIRIIP